MNKKIAYREGGENVFADIGVRDPEESLVRAKLAKQIAELIQRKALRQNQVANILGVDQSKVSKLVRGNISGFTSDRLLRYLNALGCDVRIQIRPNRTAKRGRVMVVGL
ncbi:MAG TPA: helix-turn-helix transcriptional regulator [Candidatus Acidoferrum sp.]|nr:helix-turn-helix transcriptional regulator [Candidatus Acidoferrum sp.]